MIGKIFIIILISLGVSASPDDWRSLEKQLFARKPSEYEGLEPAKTHELLQRFKESLPDNDELLDMKREGAQTLLSLYQFEPEDCYLQESMLEYSMDSYRAYDANIRPYLDFCRNRIVENCKDKIADDTREFIDKSLTSEELSSIDSLMEAIRSSGSKWKTMRLYLAAPMDALQSALANLLNSDDKSSSPEELAKTIDAKFGIVCNKISRAMEDAVDFYQTLIVSPDLPAIVHPLVLEWVARAKVCKFLLANPTEVTDQTFAILHQKQ